jgi:hypothetical protein
VDWKSWRAEAALAIGSRLVLPAARRSVAESVPGFDDLLRRCELGDRADIEGTEGLPADDPLNSEDESLEPIVAAEAARLASAASITLLRLDNGDTPGLPGTRTRPLSCHSPTTTLK